MGTNVYCDYCHKEVGHDDSFVVPDAQVVMAFHYECGRRIHENMLTAQERDQARERPCETNISARWNRQEIEDRLAAAEDQVRKVSSVWRLWLNDAQRGSINQGTFDIMKKLLGME